MSASSAGLSQSELAEGVSSVSQRARGVWGAVRQALVALVSALALAFGLQAFSALPASAAACPNDTDLLSGVNLTSFTAGATSSSLTFTYTPPCWVTEGSQLYIVFPPVGSSSPPSAPAVSNATTGGTIAAGSYQVEISYAGSDGTDISSASSASSTTTTGSTSTITITAPTSANCTTAGATGWYAYVTQAGGSSFTRQQAAGSPTACGTNLTLTAPPSSTGVAPPANWSTPTGSQGPQAPTLTTGSGSVAAGTYYFELTYATAAGETLPSAFTGITLGSAKKITITSPASITGATGYYLYAASSTSGPFYRQATSSALCGAASSGAACAIGTSYALNSTPTFSGTNPPTSPPSSSAITAAISICTGCTTGTLAGGTFIGGTDTSSTVTINGSGTVANPWIAVITLPTTIQLFDNGGSLCSSDPTSNIGGTAKAKACSMTVTWTSPTVQSLAATSETNAPTSALFAMAACNLGNDSSVTYFTQTCPSASSVTVSTINSGVTCTGCTTAALWMPGGSSDTSLASNCTACAQSLPVYPATASQYVATNVPSSATAGTGVSFNLSALDQYGNTVNTGPNNYSSTDTITTTDPNAGTQSTATAQFTNGVATVADVIFKTQSPSATTCPPSGGWTITVSGTSPSISLTTSSIKVSAGTVSKFLVSAPASSTAGSAFNVTVTAADAYGNTVCTYSDTSATVAFSSTDGSTNGAKSIPANYQFLSSNNGTHTVSFTLVTSGNQTVSATDTSNSISGTTAITINSASASSLSFSSPPSTASAGTAFSLTVQAKDAYGNLASGYTGTVSFTITDSAGTTGDVKPSNYTFTGADAGSRTFTNGFTLVHVGSPSISGSDGTLSTGNQTFSVSSSLPAVSLSAAVTAGLSGGSATAAQALTLTVTALDTYGNTVTTGTGNKDTIHITSSDTGATLPANAALSSGVKTFSVTLNTASGTGWTITASDSTNGGVTASTTSAIPVLVGAKAQIVFSTQPGGTLNGGTAFGTQPVVMIEDAAGNVVTTDSSDTVTLSIAAGTGTSGATLSGTTTMTFSGGTANFSGLSIDKAGSNYQLQAISGTFSQNSNAFTISVGPAAKLAFSTQPGGTITGGTAFPTQPVVTIQDAGGNTVTGNTSTVTLTIGSNPGGGTLSGTSSKAAVAGVASFAGLSIDKAGNGYALTATDGALTSATSSSFNIAVGAPAQLVFTTQPGGTITGGTPFPTQPVVQVQDAGGNAVTGSSSSVTLTISTNPSGGTLSGTTTVGSSTVNGNATFSGLSIDKTGNGYVLQAASGAITKTSNSFNVTLGSPALLVFSTQPGGSPTGGVAFPTQPKVTVEDAGGNAVTGSSTSVTLAITTGTGTSGATLSGTTTVSSSSATGIATFSGLSIDKSGTNYQLTATATGTSSAASNAFTVTVGPANKLVFTTQPPNATGGSAFSPQPAVQVEDAGGNPYVATAVNVTLAIGNNPVGGSLSGTATVASSTSTGIATFSGLSVNKVGTGYTLTATSGGLTSATSSSFNVTVGPATQLSFTSSPSNSTGGTAFSTQPVVALLDAGGNTTTATNNVLVEISSGTGTSGATLSGTTTVAAVNGVANFSGLSINLAGNGYQLVALSGSLTSATSSAFNITVGSPAQLVFSTQPAGNITGGTAFPTQPKVTVEDAGGNTVTGSSTAVTISITPGTGTSGAALSGTTTVSSSSTTGIATFTNLAINLVGSNYQLRASATGTSSVDSQQFTVSSGPPTTLTYTTQPGGSPTGGLAFPTQPAVAVSDAGGNPVTGVPVSITLTIKTGTGTAGATLSGTTTQAVNTTTGVATFSGLSIDKSGTGYVLTATSGSITVNSSAFNVTVGPAAKLTFTTQPGGTLTGGTAFGTQPVITVQDAGGNTVSTDSSNVTLAITTGTGTSGATLSGTTTKAASSGIATFAGLSINKAGSNYQLTATDGTLTSASSNAFNISVGPASQLAFTTQPSNSTGGVAFSTQPAVQVQDAGGNPITASSVNVTLAIGNNPGGGTLSGTTTVGSSTSTGIATFNGLSINLAGTGYTLTASAPGTTGAISSNFNITAGPAVALTFSTQPSNSTGGTPFGTQPVVTIVDAGGNTATGASNTIVLSISTGTGASGATLSGTTTVAASSGVAPFSGLSIDKAGSGYQLAAQSGTLTPTTSSAFNITVGPAAKLIFSTSPGGTITGGSAFGAQPVVTIQDAGGNTVTGNTSQVTLAIGANPGGGTLSGTASKNAISGVATFAGLSIDKAGNGYTLTATDAGLTSATSSTFNVTVGSPAQLAFITQPGGNPTGGTAFPAQPVVQVQDAGGNAVTGSAVSVTLAIKSGSGTAGASLSGSTSVATNTATGNATFTNLSIDKSGTNYILTATSGSATANSAAFNVTVGPAAQLVFSQQPGGGPTGGTAFPTQPKVTVEDAGGNTVTTDSSSVTLVIKAGTGTSGATLSGTATVNASSGVATFSGLAINKAGTNYQLHASDGSLSAVDSNAFNVSVGSASQLVFTTQPSNSTGGVAFGTQPAVQVQDAGGNPITASSVNVTLAIGNNAGGGTLSGTTTIGSSTSTGIATFNGLSINLVGTGYTLSASAAGTTGATSSPFNITAGPAVALSFSTSPSNSTGGSAFPTQPVVTITDAGGNTATGATNNVVLSISAGTGTSGATLSGTTTVAAVNGVAPFSGLSIDKIGNGYQLAAQSGTLTPATSSAFNVSVGPSAKLVFTTSPGGTVTGGTPFGTQPVVTIQDAGGNTVTSDSSTVTLTIGTNPSGGTLSGTASKSAVSGVATFSGLSIDKAGNGYTLHAADGALASANSSSFNVSVGSPSQLVFTTQPGGTLSGGTPFGTQPVVQVQDAGGNAVTGSAVSVSLSIKSGTGTAGATLSGTTTVGTSTSTGNATFSGLAIDKAGTGYQLTATSGSTTANSSAFNISVGAAAKLAFTTQPGGSMTGGVAFPTQPVVTVQDAGGNTVTTDTSHVTISITAGTGTSGAALGGTATISASNGIAPYTNLSVNKAGTNYQLHATDGALTAADSSAFNISVGPASQLVFTTQPSNSTGGIAFGTQPAVQVQDAGGNPITASSVNVTLAIGNNPGTGTLSGTATVGSSTATGVATFNGLSIDKVGNGYTLVASASGTTGAISSAFNITTGPVATMVFTIQPSSSTGGVAFGTQPSVTVSDAGGNVVTSATNNIVLSIAQGTGTTGATLGGTTTAQAVNGVATFSGLSIDKAGTAYQLEAQSGVLTPVVSSAFNITAGPAAKLAFTTQPGGTITGGVAFPTQPVVAVEDAGGNPVNSAASVTMAIKSGTGQAGASLLGTQSVNASNGVAQFSGLAINLAGNTYQLEASSAGLSVVDSVGFNVITGPPTQLTFQTEPAGASGGTAFTTQPTVLLTDAGGNQASSNAAVTLSIVAGTGTPGATLGGTVTVNAVNGLAIFSNVKIDKAGASYQLHAASGALTPTNSTAFDVTGGPAVAMTFSTSPAGALGGTPFTTQPVVTFTDAGGNTANSNASVSLSITPGTGAAGASLGGTVTVSAVNGVVNFSNVKIDKAGTNYTLTASSTAAPSATSQAFNVNVGPEAQMVITTQPIAAAVNSVMSPVVVELRDAGGNTVTGSTMPVTVSLGNAGSATLGGTLTQTPSNGDATFNDLTVSATGSGYTLIFNAGSLSPVTSNPFQVTSFTLALHPNTGPAGTQVAVSGTEWPQNSTVIVTLGGQPMTTSPSPCPTDNAGTFGPCLITIPPLNNGPADIIVTDNGGANHFTQVFTVTGGAGVVITRVTPNVYAPKPATKACPSGTCINLVGVGFTGVTSPSQILFIKPDGSSTPASAITAIDAKGGRTMTIVPPALPNIGPTHIEIVTAHGNSDPTDPNALFSYGPYIKRISPNFYTAPIGKNPGTTKVTITGINFTGVDNPSQILFGNVPAQSIISGGSFIPSPAPKTIPPKPRDTSLIVVPPPLSSEPAGTDCVRVTITTIAGSVGATAESNAPAAYNTPGGGGGPSSTIPDASQFCWGSDVTRVTPNIGPANGLDPKKGTPISVTIVGGDLGGNVTGVTLNSSGSGYTRAPVCKLTGGGGRGASCAATVTNGAVTAVTLVNAGGGYTSAPSCTLTGVGTGATCTASVPVSTTVKFGNAVACSPSGTPAVCNVSAERIIKVNLPPQAAGDPETVPVTVTTAGGVGAGTSGAVTVGTFTYGAVVNSVTLTSVKKITTKTPVLTTTFTIAGKNLNNATEIDFTQSKGTIQKACLVLSTSATQCAGGQTPNDNPATGITVTNTGTRLTVVIPSANLTLPAGTYDVVVLTPAGPSVTNVKDLFTTTGI